MRRTLTEWHVWGSRELEKAGIAESQLDAKLLLFEAFQINSVYFLMNRNSDIKLPEKQEMLFEEMIEKRVKRIPLQYIVGYQEFMGMRFNVNKNVLIPRQDTETLVELVLSTHKDVNISLLDMCTGSGCIAVSLKKLGGFKSVTGADISDEALNTAMLNAKENNCEVTFIRSDMFNQIKKEQQFDIIVSNPPYIPTDVIRELDPEVRDYEPVIALDGTSDGLLFYRRLAVECKSCLKTGGSIYFEIGHDQGMDVSCILRDNGYTTIEVIKDEPGLDRVVSAVLGG